MTDERVLIFGSGGFVGPYLARDFYNHNYSVYGSDVKQTDDAECFENFYTCDLTNIESVSSVVLDVKPTHIINLAAISSVASSWNIPQKTVQVNVCGTLNILEAAKRCEVLPKILLIGSSEEYAISDEAISERSELNANNPYGISKVMQEQFSDLYRERYGMKIYNVRAFNHTGVGQTEAFVIPSWCKQAAEISASGKPGTMYVGNTDVIRDFSDVRDIVRAYRMVLESNDYKTLYNIGSGLVVSLQDILSYIVSLSDQPIEIKVDSNLIRPADNPVIHCDHSLITKKLGWTPQYTIYNTIDSIFQYFSKRQKEGK